MIVNGVTFESLIGKYDLESINKENFQIISSNQSEEFYNKIYQNSDSKKLTLLEENDFYVLYEITKSEKVLPNVKNEEFNNNVKKMLFNNLKYKFNNDLLAKINEGKFNQNDFEKLSNNNDSTLIINSIKDNQVFTADSIKFLYSKSKNNFALIADNEKNIYLAKIIDIFYKDISKNSEDFSLYKNQTNEKIRDTIYDTYDLYINQKYTIKVNEKTLERVKNYFR